MEVIIFNTKQQLNKRRLEKFLLNNYSLKVFFWIDNFYEFIAENEVDQTSAYISTEIFSKGFKYQYSIFADFTNNITRLSIKQIIETLKSLALSERIQIFSSDDEIDPWTGVLIDSTGETFTVATDDDYFVIVGFYNFPFGYLRTKKQLNELELNILKQIIAKVFPNTDVHYTFDDFVISEDFNKVKNNYVKLRFFDNHYQIVPYGKNEWLDRDEKSELFIEMMFIFQKQINQDICIFPINYSRVKIIEGGSDSQEYCILMTAEKQEKIIYKQ